MSGGGDFATLDRWISGLRQFGADVASSAPQLGEAIRDACARDVSAGRSPSGDTFAPRKKDGGQPLKNAGKAITVTVSGDVITLRVSGPEALHHYGVKGEPARPVLPLNDVPISAAEAFRQGLIDKFHERLGV